MIDIIGATIYFNRGKNTTSPPLVKKITFTASVTEKNIETLREVVKSSYDADVVKFETRKIK